MPVAKSSGLALELILLAAGSSSRLGRAKQSVKVNDQALIARQADVLLALSEYCDANEITAQVSCVLGYKAHAIAQLLSTNQRQKIKLINNTNWQAGMGSSIAMAAAKVRSEPADKALLVLLVDQWQVSNVCMKLLLDAWRLQPNKITVADYTAINDIAEEQQPDSTEQANNQQGKKQFGPPIIFPANYTKALSALSGEQGAKKIVSENIEHCQFVSLPQAAVDLDTPADLARLNQQNV